MKTRRTLQTLAVAAVAAVVMAAGCRMGVPPEPVADLRLVALSDLADPKGLAGIEAAVVIEGTVWPDGPEMLFTAADLADTAAGMPGLGLVDHYPTRLAVDVRLHQGRVAQGRVEWEIKQMSLWELWIERSLYPEGDSTDLESPQCPTSGGPPSGECRGIWRFPVAEDVANVEDEALWLVLWRAPWWGSKG